MRCFRLPGFDLDVGLLEVYLFPGEAQNFGGSQSRKASNHEKWNQPEKAAEWKSKLESVKDREPEETKKK